MEPEPFCKLRFLWWDSFATLPFAWAFWSLLGLMNIQGLICGGWTLGMQQSTIIGESWWPPIIGHEVARRYLMIFLYPEIVHSSWTNNCFCEFTCDGSAFCISCLCALMQRWNWWWLEAGQILVSAAWWQVLLKDSVELRTGSHDAAARAEIAFLEQGLKNARPPGPQTGLQANVSMFSFPDWCSTVEQEPSGSQQFEYCYILYLKSIFSLQLQRGSPALEALQHMPTLAWTVQQHAPADEHHQHRCPRGSSLM